MLAQVTQAYMNDLEGDEFIAAAALQGAKWMFLHATIEALASDPKVVEQAPKLKAVIAALDLVAAVDVLELGQDELAGFGAVVALAFV